MPKGHVNRREFHKKSKWNKVKNDLVTTTKREVTNKKLTGVPTASATDTAFNAWKRRAVLDEHGALTFGDGILTGGSECVNIADVTIHLDSLHLPEQDILDSAGELSKDNKQRVIYYPIADMGKPTNLETFTRLLGVIDACMIQGKHVNVHCIGGHGRTGMVLACYAGKYQGIDKPIEYIRARYCKNAVESLAQINFIAMFTGRIEDMKPRYSSMLWDRGHHDIYGTDEDLTYAANASVTRTTSITGKSETLSETVRELIAKYKVLEESGVITETQYEKILEEYTRPIINDDEDESPIDFDADGKPILYKLCDDDVLEYADLFCPHCNSNVEESGYGDYICPHCGKFWTFGELI
jgi:hypothetical protein